MNKRLYALVFFIALSSLAYEVILTRFFALSQWSHLSFLVLGIALLGFSFAGVLLALLESRFNFIYKYLITHIDYLIPMYSIAATGAFILTNNLPMDFFQISLNRIQLAFLVLTFFLYSLPFLFAGLANALAYMLDSKNSGRIYFFSMTGSGLGVLGAILGLTVLPAGRALLFFNLLPLVLYLFGPIQLKKAVWAALILISTLSLFYHSGRIQPSPYKGLPQVLQFPDSTIVDSKTSLYGEITQVRSRALRFAPALSLLYNKEVPSQSGLYLDGDLFCYIAPQESSGIYLLQSMSQMGYEIARQRELMKEPMLIAGQEGGTALDQAVLNGASQIFLTDKNPQILNIVGRKRNAQILEGPPRYNLKNRNFSFIHMQDWGSSIPGMNSLNQNHLLTKEGAEALLASLQANGMGIISRRILFPPADSIKLFHTFYIALKNNGLPDPGAHLILYRNWDTYLLLFSRPPFSQEELNLAISFGRRLGFDPVYYRGLTKENTNTFSILPEAYFYNYVQVLHRDLVSNDKDFQKTYLLDIQPSTDNRPFFSSFLKLHRLKDYLTVTGDRNYLLGVSGQILVVVLLIVSLLESLALLGIPLLALNRKDLHFGFFTYFLALGAGYMLVETAFIREATFLLDNPTIGFSLVLSIMLFSSALGGWFSEKGNTRWLRLSLLLGSIMLVLYFLFLPGILEWGSGAPALFRFGLLVMLILPCAFIMGMPFPIGIKMAINPAHRAYFWAANGFTSVAASIISTFIAIKLGISFLFLIGAASYLLAFWMRPKTK